MAVLPVKTRTISTVPLLPSASIQPWFVMESLIFNINKWRNNKLLRSVGIFPFLVVNSVAKQNEILENISEEVEKFKKYNKFQIMLWFKNNYSKFEIKRME